MPSRVVPSIDGSPTYIEISLRWIDADGDMRSDVSKIDAAATDAQIDGLVVRLIAASNASLHTVRVTQVYAGEVSKDNASPNVYRSGQHNIVYHAKGAGRVSRRGYLPSPTRALFVPGTETPNPDWAQVSNLMDSWDTLWAGSFAGVSLRYTQRRDINKKVNI